MFTHEMYIDNHRDKQLACVYKAVLITWWYSQKSRWVKIQNTERGWLNTLCSRLSEVIGRKNMSFDLSNRKEHLLLQRKHQTKLSKNTSGSTTMESCSSSEYTFSMSCFIWKQLAFMTKTCMNNRLILNYCCAEGNIKREGCTHVTTNSGGWCLV